MGAFLLALALSADIQADLIRTKDGKLHAGKILDQTDKGYLFRDDGTGETAVIEFGSIEDVKRASDAPKAETKVVVASDRAANLARIYQLRGEITDLHTELEDATLGGPIVKLVAGVAFGVIAAAMMVAYANAVDCQSRSLYGCQSGGAFLGAGVPSGIISVVFFIWGGIQLRNRIATLNRLPGEISAKEAELRELEAARYR
jgi:hypothetical protein